MTLTETESENMTRLELVQLSCICYDRTAVQISRINGNNLASYKKNFCHGIQIKWTVMTKKKNLPRPHS
jgi:hypothetical protein